MSIDLFFQFLFAGITYGIIYAVVAIGFNIIYNTTGIINFAQGEFVMLGGMIAISLLKVVPLPLAIVGAVLITMAVGALRALYEANVSVPNEIGLMGFDGLPPSERTLPKLTTVRQPVTETGARAVELLLGLINGDIQGPVREIMPTELVVRESCGAARRVTSEAT